MVFTAHPTAVIDEGCTIGEGTRIWHFCHIMPGCTIGDNCNIGQNVVVSPDVVLAYRNTVKGVAYSICCDLPLADISLD